MFKHQLDIGQPSAELVPFMVQTGALTEGTYHGSYVKNGTGDYTITMTRASRRTMCPVGVGAIGSSSIPNIVSISASAINVQFKSDSGSLVDTDFFLNVLRFDSARQY